MNHIDLIVILAVGGFALIGSLRGFLRESAAVLAWLLALMLAWHFGRFLEPYLGGLLAAATVRTWAARAIIVLFVLALGAVAGTLLAHYSKLQLTSGLNRILGLTMGTMHGLILLGVLVLLGQLLRLDGERWWRQSALMPYGEAAANGVRVLVGEARVHHRRVV